MGFDFAVAIAGKAGDLDFDLDTARMEQRGKCFQVVKLSLD